MKIGIFGGTFNPPHNTHLDIAKAAVRQLGLDKLFVVPCGIPPHKYCCLSKEERYRLSVLAFGGLAEVCDYEINKDGKSYTIDTLKYFKKKYPGAELYLVVGGDSFLYFRTWKKPDEIIPMVKFAVAERKNVNLRNAAEFLKNVFGVSYEFLSVPISGISSSEIRLRYQFGMDNSQFVSKEVDDYVKQNGLYSTYREFAEKLKSYLTPERYTHTFYVVKRALQFATAENYDKVFTASLLHDCAKYIGEERYSEYGYVKNPLTPKPVVHSYLGALVAQKDFGVNDTEILDAIRYHTTARAKMTTLDKIIYVADKTEETRPYPLVDLLRGTLDEKFIKCLIKANEYKDRTHGKESDDPSTIEALKYYLKY